MTGALLKLGKQDGRSISGKYRLKHTLRTQYLLNSRYIMHRATQRQPW